MYLLYKKKKKVKPRDIPSAERVEQVDDNERKSGSSGQDATIKTQESI